MGAVLARGLAMIPNPDFTAPPNAMYRSVLTILPDRAFRRRGQGITLVRVWCDLRWRIITRLFQAVVLITVAFALHPV